MSRFFIPNLFKKPDYLISAPDFPEPEDEESFAEQTRTEALEILISLYNSWDSAWIEAKTRLEPLNLSEENLHRLHFYETEQKKTIVSLLAKILISFEAGDTSVSGESFVSLAKEMRPSLPYVEFSADESLSFTPNQLAALRSFIDYVSYLIKTAISSLAKLSPKRYNFTLPPLKQSVAEALIEEKLHISWFDFLDFKEEPEFSDGYYPALLQDSVDFGL